MTFIPGKDLGPVYKSLSKDEKKAITRLCKLSIM
jgi:hypothetical protein